MKKPALMSALAIAATMTLAAPAFAQTQAASGDSGGGSMMPGISIGGGNDVDPATAEKRREIEKAYRDATRNNGAQQAAASNDPWANMRGDEKPAVKPTAKTAHTAAPKKKPAQ